MAGATTEALLRYARAVSDDARYDALRELAAAGAGPNTLWRLLGTAPLPGNAVQALPPIDYDADLRRDEALIHRLHPEAGVEWWYWAYVAADGGAFTIACFTLRRSGAGRTWYEFASTTEAGPLLAFEGAGEPAPADGALRFPEHGVEFSLRPGLLVIGARRFAAPARPGATVFPGGRGVLGDYQYASFPLDDGANFAWADHQWGTPGKNCSALLDVGYALRWGDLANLQPVDLSFGIVGCELWMGLALRPGGAAEEEFWNVSWGGLRVPRAGEALRTKAFTSRGATVELELVPEGIGAEGAPARWRARARPGAADEWAFVVEVPVLRRFPWLSGGYIYESPARVLDAAGAPAGAGVVENVGWGASIAENAARVVPESHAALRPVLLARSRAPGATLVGLLGAALLLVALTVGLSVGVARAGARR